MFLLFLSKEESTIKMNEPISWDPSLVKKFSSSSHSKLLNQLRTEVKKYPLYNKKKSTIIQTKDTNQKNKNKSNIEYSQNALFSSISNKSTDINRNKSNVSFNNSKNFSIYNQSKDINNTQKDESLNSF
tara:strand:+ start:136 stop:522 length:387 start_codon:yes stop_codon:yes gene_type:complete